MRTHSLVNMEDRRKVELSEDCWEAILNRLALDEDDDDYDYNQLKSASLVCKQFLSITNRIRRKLLAGNQNLYRKKFEPLFRALHRFVNLKEIDLCMEGFFADGTDYLFEKIASSPLKDIQTLTVRCFFNPPSSAQSFTKLGLAMNRLKVLRCFFPCKSLRDYDLVAIADALPRLEELDIHSTWENLSFSRSTPRVPYPELSDRIVTDAGIEVISRKLRGLRKIDISWNHACSDRSLVALSSNCVFLDEIRCCNCSMTEHGIFFSLGHCPNLISLRAGYCRKSSFASTFDDSSKIYARHLRVLDLRAFENLDRLLGSIAKAGTIPLEKLLLRSGSGDDNNGLSIHGLSAFLRACPCLKHLELENIHFLDDHSIKDLCRYLPSVESVKLLFCSSHLTSAATFFTLAKHCPGLREIVLIPKYYARVGDDNFVMDENVGRNDQITSLQLTNNMQLNDKLLKRIGVVCPNLHTLDIKGCYELTKEGIGELLQCCSKIKHLTMNKGRGMEILLEQLKARKIEIRY